MQIYALIYPGSTLGSTTQQDSEDIDIDVEIEALEVQLWTARKHN